MYQFSATYLFWVYHGATFLFILPKCTLYWLCHIKRRNFRRHQGFATFQRSNVRQLCIKDIASEALVKSRTFGLLIVPFFLPPFPRARCGSLLGIYLTQISLPFSMSNESPTFRVSICNEESERITYRKRKDIHVRQMSGCARMCAK